LFILHEEFKTTPFKDLKGMNCIIFKVILYIHADCQVLCICNALSWTLLKLLERFII